MLEQRRALQKGYITLKEAAELSNYAPDYIGQLIRSGKIKGEQVYSNTAWVTTEEEIYSYLTHKGKGQDTHKVFLFKQASFKMLASCALYTLMGLFTLALLFMQYIFYVSLDELVNERFLQNVQAAVHSDMTS